MQIKTSTPRAKNTSYYLILSKSMTSNTHTKDKVTKFLFYGDFKENGTEKIKIYFYAIALKSQIAILFFVLSILLAYLL